MILLIDNYDSFTYNLVHYLGELGATCVVRRHDAITVDEARALAPDAIVISPGPGTPDDSGICCALVAEMGPEVPILGVCLGHQVIGQVYGAHVIRAPHPVHGKVDEMQHDGTGIFTNLANPTRATRYHSLVLDPTTIPPDLIINARTKDGIIMGIHHRHHPVHGVQFHPESIASSEGKQLLGNFLALAHRGREVRP